MKITTNKVPRAIIHDFELSAKEREEFDYIDWPKVDAGEDSASFFRYKGQLYNLSEFMRTADVSEDNPVRDWDGYSSDSFFSGLVVRYAENNECVIVGWYCS